MTRQVGRILSALAALGVCAMIFLIARLIYDAENPPVPASAKSNVMYIQTFKSKN